MRRSNTICNPILNTTIFSLSPHETRAPPIISNFKTLIKEDQTRCHECFHPELVKDFLRAETYCEECGLVVSMAYPYVGGNRIDNPFSYNYYLEENIYTHE